MRLFGTLAVLAALTVVSGCSKSEPPAPSGDGSEVVIATQPIAPGAQPQNAVDATAPVGEADAGAGLDSSDPLARIEAMRQVSKSNPLEGGQAAVDTILAGLADENGEVRQMAAAAAVQGANYYSRALANGQPVATDWSQEAELIEALRAASQSSDPLVSAYAVGAYGRIVQPSPDAEAFLIGLLAAADPSTQQAILTALEEHRATSPAYLDALAANRASDDPAVRTQAALSTARALGAEAIPLLEAMLADETDPLVTTSIQAAIAAAGGGE